MFFFQFITFIFLFFLQRLHQDHETTSLTICSEEVKRTISSIITHLMVCSAYTPSWLSHNIYPLLLGPVVQKLVSLTL